LGAFVVDIYTDGSCNTKYNKGAWAAIVLVGGEKILLNGVEENTTNNRMELLAVIKSIEFIDEKYKNASLIFYTDSQYVSRIPERKEKLIINKFLTNKGTPIQNSDLVQLLISQIESHSIKFVKVKAHKNPDYNLKINYNIEVDKIARHIVREVVNKKFIN